MVRHLVGLSPGVSVVGFAPVPPQSFVSKAARVVQNLMWPSPQRTFTPNGFFLLVCASVPQVAKPNSKLNGLPSGL